MVLCLLKRKRPRPTDTAVTSEHHTVELEPKSSHSLRPYPQPPQFGKHLDTLISPAEFGLAFVALGNSLNW